jgi:hypothetical protein
MRKTSKSLSIKHIKKDIKAEKEIISESNEAARYAKGMKKDDMKALKSAKARKK